ncbi:hypothetical protein HGRIS_010150 [Hohenbuehelia grisea]|uniref:Uncharacterized protein n=1 Tax=Hohenbuehelia grisea TaxID=104357 RepID=A0ABR3J3Z6_9AGAR
MSGMQPNGQPFPIVVDSESYQMNEQQLARMQAKLDEWKAMNQQGHLVYQERMQQLNQQIEAGERAKQELNMLTAVNPRLALPAPATWAQTNVQHSAASTSAANLGYAGQYVEPLHSTARIEEVPSPHHPRVQVSSSNLLAASSGLQQPQRNPSTSQRLNAQNAGQHRGANLQPGQGHAPQRGFLPSGSTSGVSRANAPTFISQQYAQPVYAPQQATQGAPSYGPYNPYQAYLPQQTQAQSSTAGPSNWSSLSGALGANSQRMKSNQASKPDGTRASTSNVTRNRQATQGGPLPAHAGHPSQQNAQGQPQPAPPNGTPANVQHAASNEGRRNATHAYLEAAHAWSQTALPNTSFDWLQFDPNSVSNPIRVHKDSSGKLTIKTQQPGGGFTEMDFQEALRKVEVHERATRAAAKQVVQTPAVASSGRAQQPTSQTQSQPNVTVQPPNPPPTQVPIEPPTPPQASTSPPVSANASVLQLTPALISNPFSPVQGSMSSLPRTPDKADKTSLARDILRALGRTSSLKSLDLKQGKKRARTDDTESDAGNVKRQAIGGETTKGGPVLGSASNGAGATRVDGAAVSSVQPGVQPGWQAPAENERTGTPGSSIASKPGAIPNTVTACVVNGVPPPASDRPAATQAQTPVASASTPGPSVAQSTDPSGSQVKAAVPVGDAQAFSARSSVLTASNTASASAAPLQTPALVPHPQANSSAPSLAISSTAPAPAVANAAEKNAAHFGVFRGIAAPQRQVQRPTQPWSSSDRVFTAGVELHHQNPPGQGHPVSFKQKFTAQPTQAGSSKQPSQSATITAPPAAVNAYRALSSEQAARAPSGLAPAPKMFPAVPSPPKKKEPLFLPSPATSPPPTAHPEEEEEEEDIIILSPPPKASRVTKPPRRKNKKRRIVVSEKLVLRDVLLPMPEFVLADLRRAQRTKEKGKGKASAQVPVYEEEEEASDADDMAVTGWTVRPQRHSPVGPEIQETEDELQFDELQEDDLGVIPDEGLSEGRSLGAGRHAL